MHLGRTHLVMESFMVATYRQLPGKHPLFQLLSPHLEGTAFINNAADKDLIGPGGIVEQLVSQKIGEVNDFVGKSVCEFLKQDLTFPALIKAQGMTQDAFPANFPYRDDGMLIWNAIHTWANDFVEIFYPSDSSIKADEYLAAWVSEMVTSSTGSHVIIPGARRNDCVASRFPVYKIGFGGPFVCHNIYWKCRSC